MKNKKCNHYFEFVKTIKEQEPVYTTVGDFYFQTKKDLVICRKCGKTKRVKHGIIK